MHGDMVGFRAFDFVLRFLFAGVVRIPLKIGILCMHFDNLAADVPRLGIPGNVVTYFILRGHFLLSITKRLRGQDCSTPTHYECIV